MPTPIHRGLILSAALVIAACAPASDPETAASPIVAGTRRIEGATGEQGSTIEQRAPDGTVVQKLVAPPTAVWDALVAALSARKVTPTIFDRAVGRAGDTSLVLLYRWNGQPLSRYLSCGATMTGPKADQERVRAVLLAQLTKLRADTVAIAVHFSGGSYPVASGNSGVPSQCTSTGRAERELIDDVAQRVTGRR
jgi:hypothetical protein